MSRENAITFLKDIRIGIEYLQNTYANHFNGEGHGFNENDRSDMVSDVRHLILMTSSSSLHNNYYCY